MSHIIGRGRYAGETYPDPRSPDGVPASILPLSTAFYVDPETNSITRNGSVANPFATLQEAFDTLGFGGANIGNVTFMVTPGLTAGPIVISPNTNGFLSIVGLTSSNRFTGAFAFAGLVTIGAGAQIGLGLANISTTDSILTDGAATGSTIELDGVEIDGDITAKDQVYSNNSIISGNVTAGSLLHFQSTQFGPGKTLTAPEIDVDATSNYYVLSQGITIVGAKVVIADLTP